MYTLLFIILHVMRTQFEKEMQTIRLSNKSFALAYFLLLLLFQALGQSLQFGCLLEDIRSICFCSLSVEITNTNLAKRKLIPWYVQCWQDFCVFFIFANPNWERENFDNHISYFTRHMSTCVCLFLQCNSQSKNPLLCLVHPYIRDNRKRRSIYSASRERGRKRKLLPKFIIVLSASSGFFQYTSILTIKRWFDCRSILYTKRAERRERRKKMRISLLKHFFFPLGFFSYSDL